MSTHNLGDHSREIDITVLRAWIAAGRPAQGPREWYHGRESWPDRWVWWPVLSLFVAVVVAAMLFVATFHGTTALLERYQVSGYAKTCTTCQAFDRLNGNQGAGNSMAFDITTAREMMHESVADVDGAIERIGAARVELAEARTKVAAVMNEGYAVQGADAALSALENAITELNRARQTAVLARGKALEAIGTSGNTIT